MLSKYLLCLIFKSIKPCLFNNHIFLKKKQKHIFIVSSFSKKYLALIKETLADDFNFRPNPFNPVKGVEAGPFPKGFQVLMGLWAKMIPDVKVHRLATLVQGNLVAVVSKFGATVNDVPAGFSEFPMFPGISPEKIKGKSFRDAIWPTQDAF